LLKDAQGAESSSSAQAEAVCSGGVAGGYPCLNVDLKSHLPLSTFSSGAGNDIWGWTDTVSSREFALVGLNDGTAFVEVTNPVIPVYLGKLATQTSSSSWRDIKIYLDHAFIVSEASAHGMQVFDLSQLLTASPGTVFNVAAFYNDVGDAHNIAINEDSGYAYIVGSDQCSAGLHMVDISTPTIPVFAGCFSTDGYVHDAHCVNYEGPDTTHVGKEICFCCNEDTVTIVDVSNKSSPVQLSRTAYPSSGYTHQGWLSEDSKRFVFGDETDETGRGINTKTLIMDVQDLDNPVLGPSYFGPSKAIDHNLYIKNGFIYLSSYRAGLRVLKINDLATADLTEIGYFDIYPDDDDARFNGAWSVFPYFDSGIVVINGIEQGLFVVTPDLTGTAAPTPAPTCNENNICEGGEDCNNCPSDCDSLNTGPLSSRCCNGEIFPDCGNSGCTCGATSPPTPPSTPPAPTPPTPSCGGNKASCSVNADCCSNNCKVGECKGNRRLGQD
jgi:choice-of-anchor B domain-containing protein